MRLFFLISLFVHGAWAQDLFSYKPVVKKLTDQTSLSLFLAGTLATVMTEPHDDEIRAQWKNHQQMSQSTADAGNFLGSGIASLMVVGGQYLWDENSSHWQNHTRALLWQTGAVFAMKYSFGRQRPNNGNYQSFPSGHTAVAFATATSLAYAYGWRTALWTYPLAAFVGMSRWSDDMHWGSDVVAGAFIGVLMGRATALDETEDSHNKVSFLTPIIGPGEIGLNYLYSF